MPLTTNNPETSNEVLRDKSVADLEREYRELLKEYERFTGDVDTQIRRMRGGRIWNLSAILTRILHGKAR
jgi:hypothetical protein